MDLQDSLIKKGGLSKIDEALLNSSKEKSSTDDSLKHESVENESSKDDSSNNESSKDDSSKDDSSKDDFSKDDSSKDDSSNNESSSNDSSKGDSSNNESSSNGSSKDDSSSNEFPINESSALVSPSSSSISSPVSPSYFQASDPVSSQEKPSQEKPSHEKTSHKQESLSKSVRSGVDGDYKEHVVGHLTELRNRIMVSGAVLILGLVIIYPFSGDIIAYLWDQLIPPSVVMSIYAPTEYLMTRLKLSAALSFCIFFPFFMYQLFKFMSRGLYKNERRFLLKAVPLSFIMFLVGACLAYFIVLPIFLTYILFYSDKTAVAQVGLAETMNTVVSLVLGFGMVFQVPLLMVAIVRMGIVKEKTLRKGRLAVYGVLIGFVFLIAPDPTLVSQLIAGIALVVLFEISLILLKIV